MLQPGAVLPRGYVVERVLGQGGMGSVYLAQQTQLGRYVAIKETILQLPDPREQGLAREQFHREAEILASLEHPGLVDVKDYFEEGDAQYLVMAFIDGETLESVVNRTPGFIPVAQVIEWGCQVCDVLTYMHEHEPPVLIRDVKPANIMLDANGRLRLIDFGIARSCLPQEETVAILKGAGTIGFAPPEQFVGTPTDARSDVYSLGATLYSLLTREVPPWSVTLATGTEPLHAPSVFNPAVSRELDGIILGMMALRKEHRCPSAAAAKEALLGLMRAPHPPSLPSPVPPVPPPVAQLAAPVPPPPPPVAPMPPAPPPVAHATPPRFCAECGSPMPLPQGPCPRCGWPVQGAFVAPPPSLPVPVGASVGTSPAPPCPRHKRLAWGMAATACLLGGLGLWTVVGPRAPSSSPSAAPVAASPMPAGSASPQASSPSADVEVSDVGMEVQTMTTEAATQMGIPFVAGARVTAVATGGAAAQAEFQKDDVITMMGFHRITQADDVASHLARRRRDASIMVRVVRGKDTRWLRLRPGTRR